MLEKVISGGQTGVDRAGLDAAINAGFPVGGYCPKGRLAEDGTIPEKYPMIEMAESEYRFRTEKNVIESDGTLILNKGDMTEGTKATHDYTVQHGKPCLIVQIDATPALELVHVIRWLDGQFVRVLNVAGPRESKCPDGIYHEAFSCLEQLFTQLKDAALP